MIDNERDVRGQVKFFDLIKGFGFIEIKSGKSTGSDIFVHAVDVTGRPLRDNDEVTFDIAEDDRSAKGSKRAERVDGGTGRWDDRERAKGNGKGKGGDRGGKGGGPGFKPGDWMCNKCDFSNFASRDNCMKCAGPKPKGRGDSRRRDAGAAPARFRDSRRRGGGGRSPSRGRGRSPSRGAVRPDSRRR